MKIDVYRALGLLICFLTSFCTNKKIKIPHNKETTTLKEKPVILKPRNIDSSRSNDVIPQKEIQKTPVTTSGKSKNETASSFNPINDEDYHTVSYQKFEKYIINNWDLIKKHKDIFNITAHILLVNKLSSKEIIQNDRVKEHIIKDIDKIRSKFPIKTLKKHWRNVCQTIKDIILYQELKEHNRIISCDDSMKEQYRIITGNSTVDAKIYFQNIEENDIMALQSKSKRLIKEQLDKYSKEYAFGFLDKYKISFGCCSKEGAYRENMEDGHTFVKSGDGNICVFGVFDGHGGEDIAYKLQEGFGQYLINGIQKNINIKEDFDDDKVRNCIQKLFLEYDKGLYEESQKYYETVCLGKTDNEKDWLKRLIFRPGSTVTLAIIIGERLFLVNLGDSRTVILQNDKLIGSTKDHKPNDPDELGRIKSLGGFVEAGRVNGNLAVSRAMGDFGLKLWNGDTSSKNYTDIKDICMGDNQLIISPIPTVYNSISISKNKTDIMLACDGIWDRMSVEEAERSLIKNKDYCCKSLCKDFVSSAEDRNHAHHWGDNMTCMVVKIKPLK